MSIRLRLVLLSLLFSIPAAAAFSGYFAATRLQEQETGLVRAVETQVQDLLFQVSCRQRGYYPPGAASNHVRVRPGREPQTFGLGPTFGPPKVPYALMAFDEGIVFAVAFLSGGTVVRRVRGLTRAVRESAEAGYADAIPVTGSDELATLARTFNEAGQGLRTHLAEVAKREETLREFVADASHDIATPLSVMQGHLSAFEGTLGSSSGARDDVASAIREAHYLGSILRNLGRGQAQRAWLDPRGSRR